MDNFYLTHVINLNENIDYYDVLLPICSKNKVMIELHNNNQLKLFKDNTFYERFAKNKLYLDFCKHDTDLWKNVFRYSNKIKLEFENKFKVDDVFLNKFNDLNTHKLSLYIVKIINKIISYNYIVTSYYYKSKKHDLLPYIFNNDFDFINKIIELKKNDNENILFNKMLDILNKNILINLREIDGVGETLGIKDDIDLLVIYNNCKEITDMCEFDYNLYIEMNNKKKCNDIIMSPEYNLIIATENELTNIILTNDEQKLLNCVINDLGNLYKNSGFKINCYDVYSEDNCELIKLLKLLQ